MSEQERERFYWQISLFFVAVSFWVLPFLIMAHSDPRQGLFSFPAVVRIGGLLMIVGTILLEMLVVGGIQGKSVLRFWVVRPSVHCTNAIEASLEGCEKRVSERLEKLGFKLKSVDKPKDGQERKVLYFSKAAKNLFITF